MGDAKIVIRILGGGIAVLSIVGIDKASTQNIDLLHAFFWLMVMGCMVVGLTYIGDGESW